MPSCPMTSGADLPWYSSIFLGAKRDDAFFEDKRVCASAHAVVPLLSLCSLCSTFVHAEMQSCLFVPLLYPASPFSFFLNEELLQAPSSIPFARRF